MTKKKCIFRVSNNRITKALIRLSFCCSQPPKTSFLASRPINDMIYHYTHKNKSTWFIQCHKNSFAPLHEWIQKVLLEGVPGGGGGGGGTLIFSHKRRLGLFFWFKILNFNFLGVFRKMNIFGGYEDFVDIFLGSSQYWASLRVISKHFRVFFKGQGTRLGHFFGVAKFQIFFWGA